jgi:hypothetical protein
MQNIQMRKFEYIKIFNNIYIYILLWIEKIKKI